MTEWDVFLVLAFVMPVLIAAAAVSLMVAVRRNGGGIAVTAGALGALLLAFAPVALERAGAWFWPGLHTLLQEPPALPLLLPGTLSVLGAWLVQRKRSSIVTRTTTALWAWSAFSGVANTANSCNPGWCGRYGFPIPYYSWSDAVIVINGESPRTFHPAGLVVDVVLFLIVATLIVVRREAWFGSRAN